MPSPSSDLPHLYSSSTSASPPHSRLYVRLFAWFGLLISVLHLFEGRSLGLLQLFLSLIGIYASWNDVKRRLPSIMTYAVGCLIWASIDALYLFFLIAATSLGLRQAAVGLVVSNTFPNLAPALNSLLESLADDAHFFSIFSSVISVFFDAMAAYWAFALYNDANAMQSEPHLLVPLVPNSPPHRTGISGFGSISRPSNPTHTSPRTMHPFQGRGHRLGAGDI